MVLFCVLLYYGVILWVELSVSDVIVIQKKVPMETDSYISLGGTLSDLSSCQLLHFYSNLLTSHVKRLYTQPTMSAQGANSLPMIYHDHSSALQLMVSSHELTHNPLQALSVFLARILTQDPDQ